MFKECLPPLRIPLLRLKRVLLTGTEASLSGSLALRRVTSIPRTHLCLTANTSFFWARSTNPGNTCHVPRVTWEKTEMSPDLPYKRKMV